MLYNILPVLFTRYSFIFIIFEGNTAKYLYGEFPYFCCFYFPLSL
jgi:hypothetical protein